MALRQVLVGLVGIAVGAGIGFSARPIIIQADQGAAADALRKFYLPRFDVGSRPDSELLASFREHRLEFDQLVAMADEDLKPAVADDLASSLYVEFLPWPDGVAAHSGIDVERADEYRQLLNTIGIRCALSAGRDSENGQALRITVVDSRVAWPNAFWESGFRYSTDASANAMFDPESPRKELRRSYYHIEGNWYLFLQGGF